MPSPMVPQHLLDLRTKSNVTNKAIQQQSISSRDAFGSWGIDDVFSFEQFQHDLQMDMIEYSADGMSLVIDIIGVEAPLMNALRRICIAEVPTMAIEKVVMYQNTSIVQDEVLSHRLGLIPIAADPRRFKFLQQCNNIPNEVNTLIFTLDVKCERNPVALETAPDDQKYVNHLVTSSMLKWVPQGKQAERFPDGIRPSYEDIVIAKLRPGQSIEAELHVEKGIGRQHTKWSPVATASYRLLPEVIIKEPIKGENARELVQKCPMGVFDIEDELAYVARPRNCTMCRECIREEPWSERIELNRIRNHFVFSIESTGQYSAADIFRECIRILKEKSLVLKHELKNRNLTESRDEQHKQHEEAMDVDDQNDESEDFEEMGQDDKNEYDPDDEENVVHSS